MDTYQDAQNYLSKDVRGNKWYISLATVFAHLPEGDDRKAFVQKFIGDTHFGKEFLASYQPNASYKKNPDNGKTSLETELESYDAYVMSLDPDVDKMEKISSYLRQEMNGNSSEILLIHLFLCQAVRELCQGKTHIVILNRAECLLKNGFAEEAFYALDYIDSEWIESKKNLISEFIMGGFMKSWKGVSLPISDYTDLIPKETLDKIADTSFDRFVSGVKNLDEQSDDSLLEILYYNARNLCKKGFGHHVLHDFKNQLEHFWNDSRCYSAYESDNIDIKEVLNKYRTYNKQKVLDKQKKEYDEQMIQWKKKADMVVQFIKTGEIEDPDLLNDEDAELSDILYDVLNNYPEEVQTDIFTQILDDEDEEKVKYINDFIEENIEDVPFDIARDFAIDGSKPAIERMMNAIWQAEITFFDDPILFCEMRDAIGKDDFDLYEDCYAYLESDDPDPEAIDYLAKMYPLEGAQAYHRIGLSLKALKTCVDTEEGFVVDLNDEDDAEWFVEVLQEALETNEEEAEEIIRNIDLDEEEKEIIFKICSEENPDLAKKLHELWEIEKEDFSEQEENDQIDVEQSGVKNSKHEKKDSQELKSEKEGNTQQELEKNKENHWKVEEKEEAHLQEEDQKEQEQEEEMPPVQEEDVSPEQEPEKEEDTEDQQKQEQGNTVDEQPSEEPAVDTDDANALFALYQEKGGIKILRKAAKLGHAEAQYQLGLHLLELHQDTPFWKKAIKAVKGTKTNKEKAMEWFKKAAKRGHAGAKRMLKK